MLRKAESHLFPWSEAGREMVKPSSTAYGGLRSGRQSRSCQDVVEARKV